MAESIATIKLNSGQGGFYDELTNIHLTVANPIARLYAGQNFTNIRKGIAVNHLQLIEGTLGPDPRPFRLVRVGSNLEIVPNKTEAKAKAKTVEVRLKEEPKAEVKPEKQEETPKTEEKVEEKAPAKEEKAAEPAPAAETVKEDKAEAEAPKKTTRKSTKKTTKKADAE